MPHGNTWGWVDLVSRFQLSSSCPGTSTWPSLGSHALKLIRDLSFMAKVWEVRFDRSRAWQSGCSWQKDDAGTRHTDSRHRHHITTTLFILNSEEFSIVQFTERKTLHNNTGVFMILFFCEWDYKEDISLENALVHLFFFFRCSIMASVQSTQIVRSAVLWNNHLQQCCCSDKPQKSSVLHKQVIAHSNAGQNHHLCSLYTSSQKTEVNKVRPNSSFLCFSSNKTLHYIRCKSASLLHQRNLQIGTKCSQLSADDLSPSCHCSPKAIHNNPAPSSIWI